MRQDHGEGRRLAGADPAKKTQTYANLGVRLTYEPAQGLVAVESRPKLDPIMYARVVSEGGLERQFRCDFP
jgi:hypothetical protein